MTNRKMKILVVDDEQQYCDVIRLILEAEGYTVTTTTRSTEVLHILDRENFNLVLSDFFMQDMDGFELLREIKNEHPETEVIIITGYGSIKNAVEAMKEGAFSYYIKSHDPEELLFEISKVKRIAELSLKMTQPAVTGQYLMHSKNPKMKKAIEIIDKVASSSANVLLLGESGVGKEAFAAYIHENSGREEKNFIPVNCHAYSRSLLESELFGHEKGAYTGATETRIGKFEAADDGTLFLDEIGDSTLDMQLKMLRVLDTKRIERIGSNRQIDVNFRLICATNRNIQEMIREGQFREDFYYRISTFVVEIPPLRERREDLVSMIHFFVSKLSNDVKKNVKSIDESLMTYLLDYDYPGNIRELKNILERLIVLSPDGILRKRDMYLQSDQQSEKNFETLKTYRKHMEKKYIERVYQSNHGHMGQTATMLGISRRQLFNLLQEHRIDDIKTSN
jgi:two-component system, NtrC family, response regulator HydG